MFLTMQFVLSLLQPCFSSRFPHNPLAVRERLFAPRRAYSNPFSALICCTTTLTKNSNQVALHYSPKGLGTAEEDVRMGFSLTLPCAQSTKAYFHVGISILLISQRKQIRCVWIMDVECRYQAATPSFVNSDNSAQDTVAWMQNNLDGRHHPALNTGNPNIVYQRDKQLFALREDKSSLDL